MASGTVPEVIASAGLTTWLIEGPAVPAAERALKGRTGVDQVAAFGTSLHVVGRDAAALEQAVSAVAAETGVTARPAETSLEDAFIRYMTAGGAT